MAARVKLTQAGFAVQHLPNQPARWGVTPEVFKRQARFVQFIQEAIASTTERPGCLAARLVALDAIKPSHLGDISKQATLPYRALQGVAIEWFVVDPIRVERRLLSAVTLNAWLGYQMEVVGPCVSPFAPLDCDLNAALIDFLSESSSVPTLSHRNVVS